MLARDGGALRWPPRVLWALRPQMPSFGAPALRSLQEPCWPLGVSAAPARCHRPRPSQTESHLGLKCVKKLIKSNHLLVQPIQMTRSFKETLP